MLDSDNIKIYQQSQMVVGQFEVSQNLGKMYVIKCINRFNFNYYFGIYP